MDAANDGQWLWRLAPALHAWAVQQTPAWLRAKVDPDDLVQQTLAEGLKHAERLQTRPDYEILAYIRRALTNNLIDAARKFAPTRAEVAPEAWATSSLQLADWLAAPDTSPSERVARQEQYDRLQMALQTLPDAQRIALEWRYLHKAKIADIAQLLDRTEGAVTTLLHRALLSMRERLKIETL